MAGSTAKSLSYRDAGVDIDAGQELVERIKPYVRQTNRPGAIGSIGGFGGLFQLDTSQYKHPLLVSGTDGVGTKLKLAMALGQHDTIGIDLVAMCVNDIVVSGAEPLFFLDYFATSKLDLDVAKAVIKGIGDGCKQANVALIGGETAEMPGIYHGKDYDLAGFCVGVVEKDELLDGQNVQAGDVLLGLASSGPHSNGYSLIRKIIEVNQTELYEYIDGVELGKALLTPTRIYVSSVMQVIKDHTIKAMAHITGGGLLENIPRALPDFTRAVLDRNSWHHPAIFDWLQQAGQIETDEMYRTFNCGIGLVVCVAEQDADSLCKAFTAAGEQCAVIGRVEATDNADAEVIIN